MWQVANNLVEGQALACERLKTFFQTRRFAANVSRRNYQSAIREWLDAESEEKSKLTVIERTVTV